MESREASSLPQHHSGPPNMMVGPSSYTSSMANNNNNNNSHHHHHHHHNPMIGGTAHMMAPAPGGGGGPTRFPFNAVSPPHHQQQQQPASKSVEPMGGGGGGGGGSNPYDASSPPGMRPCIGSGGSGGGGSGFAIDSSAKKKRGRPRKYSPDGNIALGLAPTPMSSSGTGGGAGGGGGHGDSASTAPSSDPSGAKKHRGRPPGSGKKQLDALGAGGIGFTPHVILVQTGEDIASKVMEFSQQGPRTVCILSANGAICNVAIRQPTMSGGIVSYEGRYEIISLSGSFLLTENNGHRTRTGSLCISLAGPDGRVVGGGVAGSLTAASPVQVIVGSFLADGKKTGSNNASLKSMPAAAPQAQMLNFGTHMIAGSPPSHGDSSESSEDNGNTHSNPLNRGPGFYNNSTQQLHSMQAYNLWNGQTHQ